MDDMTEDSDDLDTIRAEAALLLEKGGWCQDVYEKGSAHCMVGACIAVVGTDDSVYVGEMAAKRALRSYLGCYISDVVDVSNWNDEPDRRRDEVIAALRHGIKGED